MCSLVHLVDQEERTLRAATRTIGKALRSTYEQHEPSCASDSSLLTLEAHPPRRAQLRYLGPSLGEVEASESDELHSACAAATRVLSGAAHAALHKADPSGQLSSYSVPLLDAFWYPAAADAISPCPAHTDPGIVTVVYEDSPALEIQEREGGWQPAFGRGREYTPGSCYVLTGRQLHGAHTPCVHRVAPVRVARTSLAFELRLGEDGLRLTRDIQWQALRAPSASATNNGGGTPESANQTERNYTRAAAALSRLGL
jgi:hypothetical protein